MISPDGTCKASFFSFGDLVVGCSAKLERFSMSAKQGRLLLPMQLLRQQIVTRNNATKV